MVSELTIPLEDVVRPEFVTYMQAAKMIGVRHDTVRVYQTRSRALEAKGNPSGVPLFPKPMRIEGFRGTAVFHRAEIEAYIRRTAGVTQHPVGTARMGSDERAVVDPQLRVRGVEGLRVADASVLPVIPGGNTNAPALMVGEKAADLIREPARVPA